MHDKLLTAADAARLLGITPTTVRMHAVLQNLGLARAAVLSTYPGTRAENGRAWVVAR